MDWIEKLEKMFNDSVDDYKNAESETAKQIAIRNLRLVGTLLANIK